MWNDIRRAITGLVAALIATCMVVWLMSNVHTQQDAPPAPAIGHLTVDNHTSLVVNQPPDFAGIALVILAVAVLIFVIVRYVVPIIREQ